MIDIKADNKEVINLLKKLTARFSDMTPVMKVIAQMMRDAVVENFEAGGKPKWSPSGRVRQEGGTTLFKSGRLMKSITPASTAKQAVVGTNVVYAAIHQFGGKTKAHTITARHKKVLFFPGAAHPVKSVNHPGSKIPARPFLKLDNAALEAIKKAIMEYITK